MGRVTLQRMFKSKKGTKMNQRLILLSAERFTLTQSLEQLQGCDSFEVVGFQESTMYGVVFKGTEDDPLKNRICTTDSWPYTQRVHLLKGGDNRFKIEIRLAIERQLERIEKEIKELEMNND